MYIQIARSPERMTVSTPWFAKGQTAAELIASGKARYALSLARLRRHQPELALLSLLGSLDNVLRGYLLLHHSQTVEDDWEALLAAAQNEPMHPLLPEEVQRLQRMHHLRMRIVQGDTVTLAYDTVLTYQQFVTILLTRYGVPISPPESIPDSLRLRHDTTPLSARRLWRQYRTQFIAVLLIGLLLLVGALTTRFVQQQRAALLATSAESVAALTAQPDNSRPLSGILAPRTLAPGHTAYVRADVVDGLPLQAQPGTDNTIPVRLYLERNTAVEVLAGPVEMDGMVWWHVRVANQQGWCAGEFLEVR